MEQPTFSDKVLSQTIVHLCLVKGITTVVISPGSRNAPLSIGFTEHPDFNCYSIVDERCASFFALGMAQQTKKPVALVCTSGSALLNYYPAIAEAYYSNIPLVIISADRPARLIDVGDGQTIRQENVFANHILHSANCLDVGAPLAEERNEIEINRALNKAIEKLGPVHINAPFSEPLYRTTNHINVTPLEVPVGSHPLNVDDDFEIFEQDWLASERKMILVGVLSPNSVEQEYLDSLGDDPNLVVFTETTSNLHQENFFPAIDQLISPLNEEGFKDLQPDILVTFGGMIVSKKIKAFLRAYKPKSHYHVGLQDANDTFFQLKKHLKLSVNDFLKRLPERKAFSAATYQKVWKSVKQSRLAGHANYLKQIPFSDLKVFSKIFESIPKKVQLQLSNSATIRYSQLFSLDRSLEVFCNRGTSGIDGSTSTAIGAAITSKLPTVFVTGDLSFLYDSNALWNNYIPKTFKIIVVNNSGGGIFRILPGEKGSENFDTFFETKHSLSAKQLCEMYNFSYGNAQDVDSLEIGLKDLFNSEDRPGLLEVFTPSEVNDSVLLDYFKFI